MPIGVQDHEHTFILSKHAVMQFMQPCKRFDKVNMNNIMKLLKLELTTSSKQKLRTIFLISLSGIIIGILFANIAFGFTYYRIIKGALIGFLIMSISSTVELFVFQQKLKRISFSFEVLIRSIFYIILITVSTTLVVIIHESLEDNMNLVSTIYGNDFNEFLRGDFVIVLIFSVVASFTINFIWQINKMLGRGRLLNVILGKYRRPKAEQRIFMFLDIKSSTTIAEKLGTNKWSSFLQDFFYDITDPIIETNGEIYQYIGDEVVITWIAKSDFTGLKCLDCFFKINERIKAREDVYLEKYGIIPEFKAGIHMGEAIVTEVGDIKKEIVFHGDVLNTASRIQSECNSLNKNLLVSNNILEKISLENFYRAESMGFFKLRGKESEIELFAVTNLV